MQRHTRAEIRHQRQRYITRRLKQFARWLSEYDWGPYDEFGHSLYSQRGAPRPLDVRRAEFWDGRRVGKLSKWNGSCNCWMCSYPKYNRAEVRRGFHAMQEEAT